jgi:hypothetical protein
VTEPTHQDLIEPLLTLQSLLEGIRHPRADEVAEAIDLADSDPAAFWRIVDGNGWWAGAGSLAAETMGDNPGLPEADWQRTVRDLREVMAEIGEILLTRDTVNPGISSWVLAFRSWNASGV